MTANELADYLQNKAEVELNPRLQEASTMLRQLQTDNKELHAIAQRMAMAESDARKSLQNIKDHPVKEQDCYGDGNVYRGVRSKDSEVQTIYFNPVKELTDEEIYEVWWQSDVASNYYRDSKEFGIEFAKIILRKAQATCNGFCGEYECKENQSMCKRKAHSK